MREEVATKGSGCSLIEQDSHSRNFQRPRGMLQDAADLLSRNTREPLQELLNCRATFNILEQCSDRHAGAAKYPRTTDAIGIALDDRARGPVDHERMLRLGAGSLNSSHTPSIATARFLAIHA